ncbi:MAG: amine oxidase [Chloroflexi bacterium HGW-Chloroflexi-5]|nr:MAG: amine oxidase [Deltaproteobacteria bacterium HGW-Deltaproteobacteria-12]PKN96944.1 MAG: amine oxidase [Chloroflexi bacterium HGW-Chloroflexi-5]
MTKKYDVIVIGAGIAGLGVGAILAKEGRQKVLVLDRFPKIGGRTMSYEGYPGPGWRVDIGLHLIELGDKCSCTELNARVGRKMEWGPFSDTVDFWDGNKFINVAQLVPMTKEDKIAFRGLLATIAGLDDAEIESWDNRSLEEWLDENVPQKAVQDLFIDMGMIMTTIPHAIDMAAGEVLWIAKQNLLKVKQVLQASYPLDGMDGITSGLSEVIKENGGEIRVNCDVQEIVIKDKKALGVKVPSHKHIYQEEYRIFETELIEGDRIVCALPIYKLGEIIDFNPKASPMPRWWVKRITDIAEERTGLIGYMIGLKEPIVDPQKKCFYTALKLKHSGFPFQCFAASNFSPAVAPAGKQLLHTDIVVEHAQAGDKFERGRLLALLWEDLKEMYPGLEEKLEWRLPYYVDGCDGLARQPGLVGNFKPGLHAPGIPNLYFAGDTYLGRGLATNGAALSAMKCADVILNEMKKIK